MEIFEILIKGIIINFFGANTRYYFFKFFNKDLKKKDFESNQEDIGGAFSQGFYNFFVGIIVSGIFFFSIAYIMYKLEIL